MRNTPTTSLAACIGVLLILLASLGVSTASAGQFTVASCQADPANFSTTAFDDFATRGMKIRRACNPEGPGIRGLVTANAARRGAVPRGSVAMVAISAPPGTRFAKFRWAGSARRADCRYALQLYAEGPGIKPVPIKNVRANRSCPPGTARAQAAGYRSRTFNVAGATRIVQRVVCQGGNGYKSCSSAGANYIRTYEAEVAIVDDQAPVAAIAGDTPLAAGSWVSGNQPLNYAAHDNVGIRLAQAAVGDRVAGNDSRSCALATGDGDYANGVPCPNGPGRMTVNTGELLEGTQQLVARVQDTAGNPGASAPVTVRVDNSAPSRVDVAVDGGDGWRNTNDFALTWANPAEPDRAPIAGVFYKVCRSGGDGCSQGEQAGDGIARLPVQVSGAGEWTVSMWRKDAAGNADPATASQPMRLRYDAEPPRLAFDAPSAGDPTLVTVPVSDGVSGVADGSIEISPVGSSTWTSLKATRDGDRLVARIDDAGMPAGQYALRATVRDQARNEASTTTRADGQAMTVTLPLRIGSRMQGGIVRHRTVRKVVRRNGKRRSVGRRVTELRPRGTIRLGRSAQIAGRLTNRDGQGIGNAEIHVIAALPGGPDQLAGVIRTDATGNYGYTAAGSTSRSLRFVYAGSPLALPAESRVRVVVPASSSIRVNRSRVVNGQSVMFSGRIRSLPLPATGKLIQVEVLLSGGWQTFRTARTDAAGRWRLPYRFDRTTGVQWYRFRVRLPREAGYPFGTGASKSVRVRVRGQS